MNYEEMSDFEINKLVSSLVDFGDLIVTVNDSNETVYLCEKDGIFDMVPIDHFDPFNNPQSAWLIIVENKIGITHWSQMCSAVTVTDNQLIQVTCLPSEILRAAMICFLKMKGVENE